MFRNRARTSRAFPVPRCTAGRHTRKRFKSPSSPPSSRAPSNPAPPPSPSPTDSPTAPQRDPRAPGAAPSQEPRCPPRTYRAAPLPPLLSLPPPPSTADPHAGSGAGSAPPGAPFGGPGCAWGCGARRLCFGQPAVLPPFLGLADLPLPLCLGRQWKTSYSAFRCFCFVFQGWKLLLQEEGPHSARAAPKHRITESFELLKAIWSDLPAMNRSTHSSITCSGPSSLTWAVCGDGAPRSCRAKENPLLVGYKQAALFVMVRTQNTVLALGRPLPNVGCAALYPDEAAPLTQGQLQPIWSLGGRSTAPRTVSH